MKALRLLFILAVGLAGFVIVTTAENTSVYFTVYLLAVCLFGFVMADREVRAKDKINRIKHFPNEVVKLMLQRQYEQQLIRDITVFQKDEFAQFTDGGFDWDKTPEGYNWWLNVIMYENFELLNSQRN